MAIKFLDSFEHYATADVLKKWSGAVSASIGSTGRRSGRGLSFSGVNGYVEKGIGGTGDTLTVGFAISPNNSVSGSRLLALISEYSVGVQVSVYAAQDGTISAFRGEGSTLLGSSSAGSITFAAVWQYVEIKTKVSATVGTVEVRVNGLSVLNLTSQNTKAQTNAYANGVRIGGSITSYSPHFDDVYITDASGSSNTGFLGDVRIDCLRPTADGNYTDLTCSTGSSHYALVDDAQVDTTDYVYGSTVGNRDSYAFGDLSASGDATVYGVQIVGSALKSDSGTRTARTFVRSGGTDADGTEFALGTDAAMFREVLDVNPVGSAAWTRTSVNGAEFGVKIES